MRRDDLYLIEMVEAADFIARWLDGVHVDRWAIDELLQSAVLQKVIVIGEAARALSPEMALRHPDVPWRDAAAFRNRAVHEYFAIEMNKVWSIAGRDVPALRSLVVDVLRVEFPDLARRYEERS